MNRRIFSIALAACAVAFPALSQSSIWDGTWGNTSGAQIIVRERSVDYSWKGQPSRIAELKVSPQQISFKLPANNRRINLVKNADGTATFTTTLAGEPASSFQVWRQ